MSRSLVIVESPAKAKTINRYLGPEYVVVASMGHVRDLPKDGLSIDVEGGFRPHYEVISRRRDVVERLRNLAKGSARIVLATDPDREGEAIAHHIAEVIGSSGVKMTRVVFNEITRGGITAAMRHPRQIDAAMVEAQEARRVMDRLIGYKVSPVLWRSFSGEAAGLSAGRVQSVALRLVVERERAINSFIAIEYWNLFGNFLTPRSEAIRARLVRADGMVLKNPVGSAGDLPDDSNPEANPRFIRREQEAEELRERVRAESYAISSIARKELTRNAPLPFTTSTLQQEAGRRLKLGPKKTMQIAQKLYEGVEMGPRGRIGLITYMRTDSTRVSDEAIQMATEHIYENYGQEYLPPSSRSRTPAKKGKLVQDAHEAIRPTDLKVTPRDARRLLESREAALYEIIYMRFVASRMAAAIVDQTTVEIEGGPFLFRAVGSVVRFRGWMQAYDDPEELERREIGEQPKRGAGVDREREEDAPVVLPATIREGEAMQLKAVEIRNGRTRPPVRFTESLLVKEMESKGIGRPSTYASIVATIQERGYVEQKQRRLYATELGMKVCDLLLSRFPELFDLRFTARMEEDLDRIASGKASYLAVLQRFYRPFSRALEKAGIASGSEKEASGVKRRLEKGRRRERGAERRTVGRGVRVERRCEKCGSAMELRKGRYGHFLACLGYPSCRNTISCDEKGAVAAAGESPTTPTRAGKGSGSRGAQPRGSGRTPASAPPSGSAVAQSPTCPKCTKPMVLRRSAHGEFYGCSDFPRCRGTRPLR